MFEEIGEVFNKMVQEVKKVIEFLPQLKSLLLKISILIIIILVFFLIALFLSLIFLRMGGLGLRELSSERLWLDR